MAENRRSYRRRVLKSATIEFDRSAFSCTIRNLSDAGAALDVPTSLGIPHEFNLVIETGQITRQCRVIWRKEIGLASLSIKSVARISRLQDPRWCVLVSGG
jgi:hypothetical protein